MNKTITIHLYLSEITHDIASQAWQIGRSRKGVDGVAHAEDIQDVDSERLLRSIQTAYRDVILILSDYVDSEVTTSDNELLSDKRVKKNLEMTWGKGEKNEQEDNVLTIVMRVPCNFADNQCDTLSNAAHRYIVEYSLSDWLLLTYPSESQMHKQLAAEQLQLLSAAIYARRRPRRAHSPQNQEVKSNNEIRYE